MIRKCFTVGMAATQQQKSEMAKNQKGANKVAIEYWKFNLKYEILSQ